MDFPSYRQTASCCISSLVLKLSGFLWVSEWNWMGEIKVYRYIYIKSFETSYKRYNLICYCSETDRRQLWNWMTFEYRHFLQWGCTSIVIFEFYSCSCPDVWFTTLMSQVTFILLSYQFLRMRNSNKVVWQLPAHIEMTFKELAINNISGCSSNEPFYYWVHIK